MFNSLLHKLRTTKSISWTTMSKESHYSCHLCHPCHLCQPCHPYHRNHPRHPFTLIWSSLIPFPHPPLRVRPCIGWLVRQLGPAVAHRILAEKCNGRYLVNPSRIFLRGYVTFRGHFGNPRAAGRGPRTLHVSVANVEK